MYHSTCNNYSWRIVIATTAFSLILYGAGMYIVFLYGSYWMLFYLAFILTLEIRLMKKSCVNCFYFGKYCAFGKGKLASLLFKKGNKAFNGCKVTNSDIIPELFVAIIPFAAGIYLLVHSFSWLLSVLIILLLFMSTAGNGYIRGTLACKFCRQRELGCPAWEYFSQARVGKNL